MEYQNYKNQEIQTTKETVLGCNFENCVFKNSESTYFDKCNFDTCEFKTTTTFNKSNLLDCKYIEGSTFIQSNVDTREPEEE